MPSGKVGARLPAGAGAGVDGSGPAGQVSAAVAYSRTIGPPAQECAWCGHRLGGADEREMIELLRTALASIEAPAEQFERLGIS